MKFKEIIRKAKEIKKTYQKHNKKSGHKKWTAIEYTQGLIGDVGDLTKLIMAKNKYRAGENIDKKLAHEISDCLWSIIVIADELNINLEKVFFSTMKDLEKKIK